ncbi:putative tetratricopeptide repeat-containing domain protein [Bifidobacterium cuniculi]|uniref:Putative tetratricopeptide repeat-containing domain protein n=1 Tax=Bifidobacterium cuniculi TaxID=1688 RepID=A0A087AJL5_9BIFI|nr:hypothetical protein [Bifidobacterium cuniculi]KFI58965.1 putative tetratricopeptide repeat-containing domain protein [Bifidobacterium cuniculi]
MAAARGFYRLPLISHSIPLTPIPNQSPMEVYNIAKDIEQPAGGRGYVVHVVGRRKVEILAWLSDDMCAYPTDRPLAQEPEGYPQVQFDEHHDGRGGDVHLVPPSGRMATLATYDGDFRRAHLAGSVVPLGTYLEGTHPTEVLLAACWLANCHFRTAAPDAPAAGPDRQPAPSAGLIRDVAFDAIVSKPLPDAVDELIYRGMTNAQDATPFERYAARQLVEAGAAGLRPIAAQHQLGAIRLDSTHLFWLSIQDELDDGERTTALAVESALNRLVATEREACSQDGGLGMMATLSEGQLDAAGSATLHQWAAHARFVAEQAGRDNPWATMRGTTAARGGIWDVTTAFVAICERLVLPHRLEYRCQVDPASGQMAIRFAAPRVAMFPSSTYTADGWRELRDRRGALVASYTLRLAALLAHAAFVAGVAVTNVDVTACDGSLEGTPVLSLGFDRMPFTMDTLRAMTSGRLDQPTDDTDPAAVLGVLQPARQRVQFAPDGSLAPVEPLPIADALQAQRVPLWSDTRPLPDDLRSLLRAETAGELDIMHDTASISGSEVFDIYRDQEQAASGVGGEFELESALMQLENELPPRDPALKPLYCEYPVMRMMVSLTEGDEGTRYWKVPDGIYNAHMGLERMRRANGDLGGALAQGRACEDIAPTTVQPFVEQSMDAVEVGDDYAKSVDVLMRALELAVMPMDVNFAYYRLAYALWQMKSHEAALACYAMTLSMPETSFTPSARHEVEELLGQMDAKEVPDRERAEQMLRAAGIPVAPSRAVLDTVAKATIRLVDAGFPLAAEHGVWTLWAYRREDVIQALRRCMLFGAGEGQLPQ